MANSWNSKSKSIRFLIVLVFVMVAAGILHYNTIPLDFDRHILVDKSSEVSEQLDSFRAIGGAGVNEITATENSATLTVDDIPDPTKALPIEELKAFDFPSDYQLVNEDNELCRSTYGPDYLHHYRTHHVPYCRPGSLSSLECFRSHINDEFCIARGVRFRASDPNHASMSCNLRNFTEERGTAITVATDPEQIKDISDFREYFFETGAGPVLRQWQINRTPLESTCTSTENNGKTYLYLKREANKNLFHKLNELWQAIITLDVLEITTDPITGKAYLPNGRSEVELVVEDKGTFLGELWAAVTGKDPVPHVELADECMGTVILGLAGSSSPFWQGGWSYWDCHDPFLVRPFVARILRHLQITPRSQEMSTSNNTVVTIIDRKSLRRLPGLDKFAQRLQERYPTYTINLVDFANMTLTEQIVLTQKTDVLLGTHGAGLTHMLWLPAQSSVGEIIPPDLGITIFRNFAKLNGLPYINIYAQTPEEWNTTTKLAQAGKLRDYIFGNEAPGSEFVSPELDGESSKQKRGDMTSDASVLRHLPLQSSEHDKRADWQKDNIHITNEQFQRFADAAIAAQNHRGSRHEKLRTDTDALIHDMLGVD